MRIPQRRPRFRIDITSLSSPTTCETSVSLFCAEFGAFQQIPRQQIRVPGQRGEAERPTFRTEPKRGHSSLRGILLDSTEFIFFAESRRELVMQDLQLSFILGVIAGLLAGLLVPFLRKLFKKSAAESDLIALLQALVTSELRQTTEPLSINHLRDQYLTRSPPPRFLRDLATPFPRNVDGRFYIGTTQDVRRIWLEVRRCVEHNTNVRVIDADVAGEFNECWQWIGGHRTFIERWEE